MKIFKINKFNKFLSSLESESNNKILKHTHSEINDDDESNFLDSNSNSTDSDDLNSNNSSIIYYEKIPIFPVFEKAEMSNFIYEADDKLLKILKTIEIEHKFDNKGNLVESDSLDNLADIDLLEQIIEEDIKKLADSDKE